MARASYLTTWIGHSIGSQPQISTRNAWSRGRASCHTARVCGGRELQTMVQNDVEVPLLQRGLDAARGPDLVVRDHDHAVGVGGHGPSGHCGLGRGRGEGDAPPRRVKERTDGKRKGATAGGPSSAGGLGWMGREQNGGVRKHHPHALRMILPKQLQNSRLNNQARPLLYSHASGIGVLAVHCPVPTLSSSTVLSLRLLASRPPKT